MKFALVGIGRWGQTYIKTLKDMHGIELVGTCSRTQASLDALPEDLRIAPHFFSLSELLSKTYPDTVIIATHPNAHYPLASQALWYRKNVICEKPCMFNEEQFANIQELMGTRIFFTDYTNLYHKVIGRIEEQIGMSELKPLLKLVNTGQGPVRSDYSDLWDYGSHVAAVIYHLFPNSLFNFENFGNTDEGNHFIRLSSREVDIQATFGNRSMERHHSFDCICGGQRIFWQNDKTENPLRVMLEKFAFSEVSSNIDLSHRIYNFLTHCEKMNKKLNLKS